MVASALRHFNDLSLMILESIIIFTVFNAFPSYSKSFFAHLFFLESMIFDIFLGHRLLHSEFYRLTFAY